MWHIFLVPFLAIASLFHTVATPTQTASNSIVHITGISDSIMGARPFSCTGFVVRPNEVLTAAHCVDPETDSDIQADGVDVQVMKRDPYFDLALLHVTTPRKPVSIRTYDVIYDEPLEGIGYAWGWPILSVLKERPFLIEFTPNPEMAPGIFTQGGYIHGMSGGPVIDAQGYVVGIMQQTNEGVGYGVSEETIRTFLLGTK